MADGRWRVLYAAQGGARPYYHNEETGETTWTRPEDVAERERRVDVALFGVNDGEADAVAGATDDMRANLDDGDAFLRTADVLARVLENARRAYDEDKDKPGEGQVHKHRRLRRGNATLAETVFGVPGGLRLLQLVGFVTRNEGGEAFLVYSPGEARGRPHAVLDTALSRLRTLREGAAQALASAKHSDAASAYTGGNHSCSRCGTHIDDGTTRLFSRSHDAPRGQFRYNCSTCAAEGVVFDLCETCWDAYVAGAFAHAEGRHAFETVHPTTQRHSVYNAESSARPWGGLGGVSVGRARDRLRERTGL